MKEGTINFNDDTSVHPVEFFNSTVSTQRNHIGYCKLEQGHEGNHEAEYYFEHKCSGTEECCNLIKENRCPFILRPVQITVWVEQSEALNF